MPELPEVETVRRGLAPAMEGATFIKVEQRRATSVPFPRGFRPAAHGRKVVAVGRRAKYLTIDLDDDTVLVAHLGMSGSFRIEARDARRPRAAHYHARGKLSAHDHVVFHVGDRQEAPGPHRLQRSAPVRARGPPCHGEIGFPPFRRWASSRSATRLDGAFIATKFAGRSAPLKAALDQRLIARLAIYMCARRSGGRGFAGPEGRNAGHQSEPADASGETPGGSDPRRPRAAIKAGGSSLRDHIRTTGELGEFQHDFKVYDREGQPCPRPGCRGIIRRKVHSGRSTFYCPVCQR
jgi:formamidopyrimidine-DNA glycosylase